jgi:hypothetical protein
MPRTTPIGTFAIGTDAFAAAQHHYTPSATSNPEPALYQRKPLGPTF